MWWQILLVLAAWIVSSLIFGVVWALGHRKQSPHRCRACTMPKERGPLMKSAADHRHLLEPPTPSEWCTIQHNPTGQGQKSAPVHTHPQMRVIAPVPRAPKK